MARVLVLTKWFPTQECPTRHMFIKQWAQVTKAIADCQVIHLDVHRGGTARSQLHAPVTEVGHPSVWRISIEHGRAGYLRRVVREILAVRRCLRGLADAGWRPDLVHVHVFTSSIHALWIRMTTGTPFVISEHFSDFIRGTIAPVGRVHAWLGSVAAAALLPVSAPLAEAMQRYRLRGPFIVLPNPVDVSSFQPAPPPAAPPLRIACITRLERFKGYEDLLHACRLLIDQGLDLELLLIGDGSELVRARELVTDLALDHAVTLVGRVPRSDVVRALRDSHLAIVPSHAETFSLAAAEALAAGRPVIVTRCGGPESFVDVDNGEVVDPGSPQMLAGAIRRLADRLSDFDASALHQAVAGQFGPDSIARRLQDVYSRVLRQA